MKAKEQINPRPGSIHTLIERILSKRRQDRVMVRIVILPEDGVKVSAKFITACCRGTGAIGYSGRSFPGFARED